MIQKRGLTKRKGSIYASVCVPTFNRLEDLTKTIDCLKAQKYENFEVIIVDGGDFKATKNLIEAHTDKLAIKLFKQEKKGLVSARNELWRKSNGNIVCFIDDDVQPKPEWLSRIVETFHRNEKIGGVGGPSFIPNELMQERDLSKHLFSKHIASKLIRSFYFNIFLKNKPFVINKFYKTGVFSVGSMSSKVVRQLKDVISVDYLDASNMCFKKQLLNDIGGFDTCFRGVGDYSEPDVCFKIKKRGYKLFFDPKAIVYHHPSKKGVFKERANVDKRFYNFVIFYRRHLAESRLWLADVGPYLIFLSLYGLYKTITTFNYRWMLGIKGIFDGLLERK